MKENQLLNKLLAFDTPTVSNVVGTFPNQETCLGLYNPWEVNWYTDERLHCIFPEHGRRAGYVVTAVYGMPDSYHRLDFVDILQQELIRAKVLPENYDFDAHKELVPMQAGDVPITYADTSALEKDFGFRPNTSLREGLRSFAEWYKKFYKI